MSRSERRSSGRARNRLLRSVAVLALALVLAVGITSLTVMRLRAEAAAGQAVTVPASAVPTAPAPRVQTVAFMGDSYSAGAGSSGYNASFTTLLSAYEGWRSTNFAYGGTGYVTSAERNGAKACAATYCPSYPQVIAKVKAINPTIVVVSGGRNDLGKPEAQLEKGVPTFYKALRAALPHARIYATSPLYDTRSAPAQLSEIANLVRSSVTSCGGVYLDIGQPLHGRTDRISGDGVHPNDLGHAAIAQAIEVALSRLPASEKP
jgi:lysophospholipase L1-like esterase